MADDDESTGSKGRQRRTSCGQKLCSLAMCLAVLGFISLACSSLRRPVRKPPVHSGVAALLRSSRNNHTRPYQPQPLGGIGGFTGEFGKNTWFPAAARHIERVPARNLTPRAVAELLATTGAAPPVTQQEPTN